MGILLDWWVSLIKWYRTFITTNKSENKNEINNAKEDEIAWERETVILPENYFVSITGQMMRDPVKRKTFYKRYKVKK